MHKQKFQIKIIKIIMLTVSIFAIGTLFLISEIISWASDGNINSREETVEVLTNLTMDYSGKYHKGSGHDRELNKDKLIYLIHTRKAKMEALIKTDTDKFLEMSLSESVRDRLPSELKEDVEEPVEMEGTVDVIAVDDFQNKKSELLYSLKDASNPTNRYELYFSSGTALVKTGDKIKIKGLKISKNSTQIAVKSNESIPLEAKKNANLMASVVAPPPALRNVLFILINFQDRLLGVTLDGPGGLPALFNSPSGPRNYYEITSFNQLTLSADYSGPYTIQANSTDPCSNLPYNWTDQADQLARAQGYNLNNYQHIIHVFPQNFNCSWTGLGALGGTWIAIQGFSFHNETIAHEIGHNLGMNHASSVNSDGSLNEYGDYTDVMGAYNNSLLNAPHMAQMQWTSPNNIQTITTPGNYTIYPLHDNINMNQILKIPFTCYSIVNGCFYYVSLRGTQGMFEGSNLNWNLYTHRAHIHWFKPPNSNTRFLKKLEDGESLEDYATGILIRQVSHAADGSSVTVHVDPQYPFPCIFQAPTVQYTGFFSSSFPGGSISRRGHVTNHDPASCGPRAFSLSAITPAGISSSFSSPVVTVNPQETVYFDVTFTSSLSMLPGVYPLQIDVTHMGNPNLKDTKNLNYTIDAPPPTPYEIWKGNKFTPADQSNALISGLNADPDGDNIINFFEYAYNFTPISYNSNISSRDVNPFRFYLLNNRFTIEYRKNTKATDLQYRVTVKSSLTDPTWQDMPHNATYPRIQTIDSSTAFITDQDIVDVSTPNTMRFFRLEVTLTGYAPMNFNLAPSLTNQYYSLIASTTGSGSISSAHLNCGPTCSFDGVKGTRETLIAQPASGYQFTSWSGSCSGTGNCEVTLDAPKTVQATFSPVHTSGGDSMVSLCYRCRTISVPFYVRDRYVAKGAKDGACLANEACL